MIVPPGIEALRQEMQSVRRDLHAHPETAFEEVRTAELVAARLRDWGYAVTTGIAKTGLVGSLRAGRSARAIGLRADMDALHIPEANAFAHKSRNSGKMHACGHDGHTAMLLGAARYLAETRNFDGTLHLIFQPAEENEGGGRVMVEEGLFERFPVDGVYGMHNMPGIPVGQFAVMPGPMMACYDIFEITIQGKGAHAAMPHHGRDPIVAGAALVEALQTVVSRIVDPMEPAVLSVTQFHAGDTWNVIPDTAVLRGTVRAFRPELQDLIEANIRRLCDSVGTGYGVGTSVRYERRYPPTINSPAETEYAAAAIAQVVGAENARRDLKPLMGAEDFAFMLQKRPGCDV
jgi:amidohydrolase